MSEQIINPVLTEFYIAPQNNESLVCLSAYRCVIKKHLTVAEKKFKNRYWRLAKSFKLEHSKINKRPRSGSAGGSYSTSTWPLYPAMYIMKDHLFPAESSGNLSRSEILIEYNSEGELDSSRRPKRTKKENQDPDFVYRTNSDSEDSDISENSGDSEDSESSNSTSISLPKYASSSSHKQKMTEAKAHRERMWESEQKRTKLLKTLVSTVKNRVKREKDDSTDVTQQFLPTSTWKFKPTTQDRVKKERVKPSSQQTIRKPPKTGQKKLNSKNWDDEFDEDQTVEISKSDTVDLTKDDGDEEDSLESPEFPLFSDNDENYFTKKSKESLKNLQLPYNTLLPPSSPEDSPQKKFSPVLSLKGRNLC